MVCVEAAVIEKSICLKPGEEWKGRQEITAVSSSYCSGQLDPYKVLNGWDGGSFSNDPRKLLSIILVELFIVGYTIYVYKYCPNFVPAWNIILGHIWHTS